MRYLDIKEGKEVNSGTNVQSKVNVNSCKVVYRLSMVSEMSLKDFNGSTLQF